jgi:hypothetical protein
VRALEIAGVACQLTFRALAVDAEGDAVGDRCQRIHGGRRQWLPREHAHHADDLRVEQ